MSTEDDARQALKAYLEAESTVAQYRESKHLAESLRALLEERDTYRDDVYALATAFDFAIMNLPEGMALAYIGPQPYHLDTATKMLDILNGFGWELRRREHD